MSRSISARDIAAAAFAVVAIVAAAISYDHVQTLAGDVWWAWLLPLSIDGLLVAGSLALWLERRDTDSRGSALTWTSVLLGLAASLAANLAATSPIWFPRPVVDVFVAVWPPIALALAFELLVRVRRQTGHQAVAMRPMLPTPADAPTEPASAPAAAATGPLSTATRSTSGTDSDVVAAAKWAAAERRAGRSAGRQRIQDECHLSKYRSERAAELATQLLDETASVA